VEKKFDVTLKSLLEDSPADWSALAGVPDAEVTVIDADIATISGAADKVLRIEGPQPWIMHFEFQSGPDASLPRRMNLYNAALEDRHQLPVASVAVLLCPQANLTAIDGNHRGQLPRDTEPYRIFRYQVIRVWELPVERLLSGGLARLALAPIGAIASTDLSDVLRTMRQRLETVTDRGRLGRLWTAVYVLMGMRYDQALVDQLLQGVLGMKESVTYQAIVAEGRVEGLRMGRIEEARKILLELGQERFGKAAPPPVRARIMKSEDVALLERLTHGLFRAKSWQDLFPQSSRPSRRKPKDR
jgi:predicted transposase YdaD